MTHIGKLFATQQPTLVAEFCPFEHAAELIAYGI
jgi:hypothetical protein